MRYRSAIFVISPALIAVRLSFAMEAAASDTVDVHGPALDEIRITAERRSENLQSVPLAATAISGDELAARGVVRLTDLQTVSPALSITDAGPTESVNIRGIGLATVSPAASSGVAQYVDGLFQPQIVTRGTLYDVADIEVLRGPQGTLVGSNSTGGAIFVTHREPELGAMGGYGQVGYGDFGAKTAQGATNLPLSDTLSARVAGDYSDHGSFYRSIGPVPTTAGRLVEKSGRLSLLWKPGFFQALARLEYADRNTGGYALRPIPGTEYAAFAPAGDFTLAYDSPTDNYERALVSGLELRFELAHGVVLRSLSGYQERRVHNLFDTDSTTEATADNPSASADQRIHQRDASQEINILSPSDGALNWLAGGYAQRSYVDIVLLNTTAGFPASLSMYSIRTTTGAFAQVTYHLTSRYEIQFGVRDSQFRVGTAGGLNIGAGLPGFPAQGLPVADLGGRHRDDRPTGKLALNVTPDDHDLLYVFAARGYKPGGVNSKYSDFNPETVWDYESGWKRSFLEGRARLQIGAFYDRYEEFQFQVTEPSSGQLAVNNIARARIAGVELQTQARLGAVALDANAAYVASRLSPVTVVDSRLLPSGSLGPQCPAQPTAGCFDYGPYLRSNDGGPNLYSPKWTFNAGAEFRGTLPNGDSLTPRLNYAYLSGQYTNVLYSPVSDYLASHGLLSASLTLRRPNGWRVDAYGANLTNKTYVSGQYLNEEFFGAPRQYGIRLEKTF
jgi:iron complex outermembrane receptor protein